MQYVVALGNPGDKYVGTRHNIGWEALDYFAEQYDFSSPETYDHLKSVVRKGLIDGQVVWLVYPQTFMNNSGETVASILHDDSKADITIVHDDSSLPLGSLRIVSNRGSGGHNGVKSIFDHTKRCDFTRLRLGIAPVAWWSGKKKIITGKEQASFVLKKFTFWENSGVEAMITVASKALYSILTEGSTPAMNKYNKNSD